ncbi:predicted protein [Histoplasma mississippiense (nom. inval.)]|uniref:predicted protein n=1 Tax=Ajellomyces capsulatus (strain NAm1 / WU24) TaxID=2059318 RepID=UPI000157B76D|nr:predicted protein [Histoplasma mississippiense (nom. inval.)]EDN03675.1 predicted protein [Histoplasma mississippiense (nom. inval.)]
MHLRTRGSRAGLPGWQCWGGRTRIDLPLWLGEMLAVGARTDSSPLVTLDLPSALSEKVMNALKADPRTVDLRSLAPHFYRLGVRILQLFEEEEMVDVLMEYSEQPIAAQRRCAPVQEPHVIAQSLPDIYTVENGKTTQTWLCCVPLLVRFGFINPSQLLIQPGSPVPLAPEPNLEEAGQDWFQG